jgi:hypothetical protein
VDGLEHEAGVVRHDRDQPAADQRAGQERAREQAADPGGGVALEDQSRTQPYHAHLRSISLDRIEDPLDLRLVA